MTAVTVETRTIPRLFSASTTEYRAVLRVALFGDGGTCEWGTPWTKDQADADAAATKLRAEYGPDFGPVGTGWQP